MIVQVQTSLPVGGPDTLLSTSPPGAVKQINSFEVCLSVSAGSVTITPYFWSYGKWFPLGDDITAPKSVTANFAGVANACARFVVPAVPRVWAFLKSGAGTVSVCGVDEGPIS